MPSGGTTEWSWKAGDKKLTMSLDGAELRFHVRERDNRVAIVLYQPGWAAVKARDFWYVALEDLVDTGVVDEGQAVKRWRHRDGSTHHGGVGYEEAMRIARQWYEREALTQEGQRT